MFRVNKCRDTSGFLHFGNHVLRNCCFAAGFRAVNFNNTPAWKPANPKRQVKRQATRRNGIHHHALCIT